MNRYIKGVCFTFLVLVLTMVYFPLKSLNIMASDTDLKTVTVIDDAVLNQYRTGAKTVEAFFKELDIQLNTKDQCDRQARDQIVDDMVITITRGINVTVFIDGDIEEERVVTQGTTVERLMSTLQEAYNVALLYDGDMQGLITEGETLQFTSWYSTLVTTHEFIPYALFNIETTALMSGKSLVRQEGALGEKHVVTAVIYIGGVEHQREVVEEKIIKEPVAQIVDIGVGGTLGMLTDVTSPYFTYIQKLTMNASAYTAGYESTGKNPGDWGYGITFTGEPVRRGIVSVDPSVIPLGTRLYVDGYGYSLAADTGSAIKGNMIDLFYESLDDALEFGRRNLTVYILE